MRRAQIAAVAVAALCVIAAVVLIGDRQSRPSQVASLIDWGPIDCRGLVVIHRGEQVTGLGYQWKPRTVDQAQIACGGDGPNVTWWKFRSDAAARRASDETIGAPKCLSGREIVVDLFDFGGAANRRAFARTCARLGGVVRPD